MRRAMARPRPVPPGVPCAGVVEPTEAFEDRLLMFGRDWRAVVGHVDYGLSAFVV
jgi:hypothetical protein